MESTILTSVKTQPCIFKGNLQKCHCHFIGTSANVGKIKKALFDTGYNFSIGQFNTLFGDYVHRIIGILGIRLLYFMYF
ncbi:MAG TPA: hypothetical protein DCL86_10550 [Bacteroidales bacterium]|nr:hypothetical protein [Bacteroidales bacterium]